MSDPGIELVRARFKVRIRARVRARVKVRIGARVRASPVQSSVHATT